MRSEAHDFEFSDPEHRDLIALVEQMYMESDSKVFKIFHSIADLAMEHTDE